MLKIHQVILAGAGFKIVFTFADLAISKPFLAAANGCSS